MRFLPWAKVERRESATDAIVSALISQAGGSSVPPSVEALAAVEAAAGLWSRAFASATVEPQTPATIALTPSVLSTIGRALAVRGEALFEIEVNGTVVLTQAASWEVSGGVRPALWRYKIKLPLPGGGMIERTVSSESVLHLRYATRPTTPWRGISPLGMADETRALASWIEKRLAEETSTATSYVLPLVEGADTSKLRDDIKSGRGKLHIVDSTSGGWGDGTAAAPRQDWKSNRLGANPPESLVKLRSDVKNDVFGVYGIPSSIHGTGGSARESYRQFLSSTIQPLAKIIVEELAEKLDTPTLALGFTELRAADIASRARAFKQLVDAGMDATKAAALAGLD